MTQEKICGNCGKWRYNFTPHGALGRVCIIDHKVRFASDKCDSPPRYEPKQGEKDEENIM